MGVYVYGVSSKTRKLKGLDEPVHMMKYLFKPHMFQDNPPLWDAWVARYESAPSKNGKLVIYDPLEDHQCAYATEVYRYHNNYNTYYDSNEKALEFVGYGYLKSGENRYTFTTDYNEIPEQYRDYVTDYSYRETA